MRDEIRVWKPQYKGNDLKKYVVDVVDKREKRFRKVLKFSISESKDLTKDIGRRIRNLINYAAVGQPDPDDVTWFQDHAERLLQKRLSDIGLLPRNDPKVVKPLLEYLPEFHRAIFEKSKDDRKKKTTTTDTSAKTMTARVRKIIEGCGFVTWEDVSAAKVNDYIDRRPDGMSQQTAHFYSAAFRRFCKWMFDREYIDRPPEIRLVEPSENYGRCFEPDEFRALLAAALRGPDRYGLTGQQRHLVYLIALETGLRRGELRSLTVASVDLKRLQIFVRGGADGATKNKKPAVQCITPETGAVLREYIKGKMPNVQLFPSWEWQRSGEMVRADCADAGVEAENHKGKLGLHSLRHTCGSFLLDQGVHPKEVMEIMRHEDYKLTMKRYGHLLAGRKQEAVSKLPRFALDQVREVSA